MAVRRGGVRGGRGRRALGGARCGAVARSAHADGRARRGTDYTYNPRGTLATSTKAGATTNHTFDAFDRLIADGESLYSYDALGRVTSRIRGTAKQTFPYSGLGNDLAAITDGSGAVQARYARDSGGNLLGLKEGAGAAMAALSDLHGDLVATYTTTLQTSAAYDPFGTVIAQTGTKTQLGYQGEYSDPDTGKVNMHARWYQPRTGTFTSRDTVTLNPSPSVQANRYTYANATPLTGTDPTGHMTYYTPDSSGNYVPSSGGYCQVNINAGTSECTPTIAETDTVWYYENYVLPSLPSFSDEEAKRIGVMTNGMTAPDGYWDLTGEERADVTDFVSWINFLNPSITEEELLGIPPSGDPNIDFSGSNTGGSAGPGTKSYYDQYKGILPYRDAITKASQKYDINRRVLTAVIIWESMNAKEGTGYVGAGLATIKDDLWDGNGGWGASVGITQLELYKAHMMIYKNYGKKYAKMTIGQVTTWMMDPAKAIDLAAAWMAHLKVNIKVIEFGDYRELNDMEAAIAYCGCSGVVNWSSKTGAFWVPKAKEFAEWMNTGDTKGIQRSAIDRKRDLEEMLKAGNAVSEFWGMA
ncbi:RHS repeat-associated core domain-containing protein [Nonomuraea turkmeniaca]|uniref:RHS repeat-associated core domain-containing protein n=1 Tax=Nonomuraea turkmeniaca TaxID=103838 RepID=A0A5S4FM76_9ACTN|nr:RHS repeat-associated core domain-containing protein [Nonomuraea turkmeniaca]TMR21827.1 RHS repeat-associated core domain-containing protein [Nonomuraea turkmeniaca]